MFPRIVNCEDCGRVASVRGYGRIAYDWPEATITGRETTIPTIKYVRLTVDCPCCGVKPQDFYPDDATPPARHFKPAISRQDMAIQSKEVRFQRLGPMNRARL